MIGIYHSRDLDGFTSGALIKLKYPNAKMIGYDYGEKLDIEPHNEMIIMADVSLPMNEMYDLAMCATSFVWIDHHISAIKAYKETAMDFLTDILEDGIAACEGTWKYLFRGQKMPFAVQLLGEYDTWRNSDKQRWENEILPFQFGMRQHCNGIDSFPIEVLTNDKLVWEIIEQGKTILKYQAQVNSLQCKKASFEANFNGLRAICLNGGGFNSDVFKSVYDESKHDIMMPFQFNGFQWIISLYTTKDEINCSEIAKENGGGGHKKAAGFQVRDIREVFKSVSI